MAAGRFLGKCSHCSTPQTRHTVPTSLAASAEASPVRCSDAGTRRRERPRCWTSATIIVLPSFCRTPSRVRALSSRMTCSRSVLSYPASATCLGQGLSRARLSTMRVSVAVVTEAGKCLLNRPRASVLTSSSSWREPILLVIHVVASALQCRLRSDSVTSRWCLRNWSPDIARCRRRPARSIDPSTWSRMAFIDRYGRIIRSTPLW